MSQEPIEIAIKKIAEGFYNLKKKSIPETSKEEFLIGSSIRSINLSKAIINLCSSGFIAESVILLRSLIETSVNMRWVMNGDSTRRVKAYFATIDEPEWLGYWSRSSMGKKISEIGFRKDYYTIVVLACHQYVHGKPESLPYRTMFPTKRSRDFIDEDMMYLISALMLGHVIKALRTQWPQAFPKHYFEHIFNLVGREEDLLSRFLKLKSSGHFILPELSYPSR